MNFADTRNMNAMSFLVVGLLLGFVINDVASAIQKSYFQNQKVVDEKFFQNFIIAESNSKDHGSENHLNSPKGFRTRPSSRPFTSNSFSGSETIPYKDFEKALHRASLLGENVVFQDLNPYHRELARPLFQILMRIEKGRLDETLQEVKNHVNKYLYLYLSRLVTLHRSDTMDTIIPSHVTLAPHLYFDLGNLAMEKPSGNETVLYLSGNFHDDPESRDLEYRLSHFRLDPGMNTHHEHWHISHLDSPGYIGDWSVDRSGEMFYYMHSQMISRYNFERLCAKAPLVQSLLNLRDPIAEPYFEKLQTEHREKLWDSRPANQIMTDINVRGFTVNVQELEVSRTRVYDAIDRGQVYRRQGDLETVEPLNGPKRAEEPGVPFDIGVDKLGNMVWAYQNRSVNYKYYGSLHNQGHVVLGNIHDPQGVYHRQSRAMAMSATYTAARDPVFYRWHKFIDDVFERYKSTLPEYTEDELDFKDISVSDVQIKSCKKTNTISTRWVRDRVNITEGISSDMKDTILQVHEVYYDFVHLAQDDFEYHIKVTSKHSKPMKGTIRIFMAPIYKDWKFEEQLAAMDPTSAEEMKKVNKNSEPVFNKYRRMFIELDKFVVDIPGGQTTTIIQSSKNSSVTVPFKRLFMTNEEAKQATADPSKRNEYLAWNGCGWPEYMLVGRGDEKGFPVQLFVMISDFDKDKVSDHSINFANNLLEVPEEPHGSMSHCGVPGKKHPDGKPMGYPFDRNVDFENLYLHHFMSKSRDPKETPDMKTEKYENMKVIDITVQHFPGNPVNGSTINPKYNACELKP